MTVELALLVARLLLAAVFLLAGVAKLADRKGSTKALRAFGLALGLVEPMSWLLPAAEITAAVGLVPLASAWYAACGALALVGIFVVGIGVNLARGRNPHCHCFGQLHSAPVGWPTLVRNALLGAIAAWLVSRGPLEIGPSFWAHLASAGNHERRMFILAACVLSFLLFRALRPRQPAEPQIVAEESPMPEPAAPPPIVPADGLPIGSPAPDFALPAVTGQQRSLTSLREEGKTICMVFISPYCESCTALLPAIGNWTREHQESFNFVVVSRGTPKENLAKLKDFDASRVLLQQAFEVSEIYGITANPTAVLIDADGLIQSNLVVGRDEIRQFLSSSAKLSSMETPFPPAGLEHQRPQV